MLVLGFVGVVLKNCKLWCSTATKSNYVFPITIVFITRSLLGSMVGNKACTF